MDSCRNFANNLMSIKEMRSISLAEFSKELAIPKSTLQDVLKGGDTSLHTALHIANHLGVPLSSLTNEPFRDNCTDIIPAIMKCFDSFAHLSSEKQREVVSHILSILDAIEMG